MIEGTAALLPPRLLLEAPDGVTRSSLAQALSQKGYEVARAASSEEALMRLESHCLHRMVADLPGDLSVG